MEVVQVMVETAFTKQPEAEDTQEEVPVVIPISGGVGPRQGVLVRVAISQWTTK